MAHSVEWFAADLARGLTGALAFVEYPDVQTAPTAPGDVAGCET